MKILQAIVTILLLPIVFPILLLIWLFRAIFGPKTVAIDSVQQQRFLADAQRFQMLAEHEPDDFMRALIQEIAACVETVADQEVVKSQALRDYARNTRMLAEMDLTTRMAPVKFNNMIFMINDAAKRLRVNQHGSST